MKEALMRPSESILLHAMASTHPAYQLRSDPPEKSYWKRVTAAILLGTIAVILNAPGELDIAIMEVLVATVMTAVVYGMYVLYEVTPSLISVPLAILFVLIGGWLVWRWMREEKEEKEKDEIRKREIEQEMIKLREEKEEKKKKGEEEYEWWEMDDVIEEMEREEEEVEVGNPSTKQEKKKKVRNEEHIIVTREVQL